ncbi:hypothetical protein [Mycoplasma nasistruthionis]|uniref:Lipoprotein n=1 Tax=Mycoplasma nasistruthionis TaxID=353852 RepID=A0A5B7XUI5_9MOLU|nr:hypothetical protein [Mycoplasma nasistruthionis]QCZ36541.1 hypothetical protein FG904_00715 [Mycoplasma nasistruthionis]
MKKRFTKLLIAVSAVIPVAVSLAAISCKKTVNKENTSRNGVENSEVKQQFSVNAETLKGFGAKVSGNIGTRFQVANILRGALNVSSENVFSDASTDTGISALLNKYVAGNDTRVAKYNEFKSQFGAKLGALLNFMGSAELTSKVQSNTAEANDYLSARTKFNEKAKEFLMYLVDFAKAVELSDFADSVLTEQNKYDYHYYVSQAVSNVGEGTIYSLFGAYKTLFAPKSESSANDLARFLEANAGNLKGRYANNLEASAASKSMMQLVQMFSLIANRMDLLIASREYVQRLSADQEQQKLNKVNELLASNYNNIKTRIDAFKGALASTNASYQVLKSLNDKLAENSDLSTKINALKAMEGYDTTHAKTKALVDATLALSTGLKDKPAQDNAAAQAGLLSAYANLVSASQLQYEQSANLNDFMKYFDATAATWRDGLTAFQASSSLKDLVKTVKDAYTALKADESSLNDNQRALLEATKTLADTNFDQLFNVQPAFNANSTLNLNHQVRNLTSYLQYTVANVLQGYKTSDEAEVLNPLVG